MAKGVRKINPRERRKRRIRKKIAGRGNNPRLSVYRSERYTYVQLINDEEAKTVFSLSTQDKSVQDVVSQVKAEDVHNETSSPKSCRAARALGQIAGEKCKEAGFEKVVFDRNGFLYHGRIRSVAEGLRASGIAV